MHVRAAALAILETFLTTDFSGDDRHSRRIAMLTDYEGSGVLPDL
jgi:ribose 5-phosphate isomerase B